MIKKAEHYWKSLIHDGDTVSVHRPSFYARRFQSFMKDKVFKKMAPPNMLKPALSFRRSHFRRTMSRDEECVVEGKGAGQEGEEMEKGEKVRNFLLLLLMFVFKIY